MRYEICKNSYSCNTFMILPTRLSGSNISLAHCRYLKGNLLSTRAL